VQGSADGGAVAGFERLVARLDYPMFVATARSGGERSGCLVGFASQCSISPPRFVVWISVRNHTFSVAKEADVIAVHALSSDQIDLAELFGGQTGDEVDKFARCAWHDGPGGVPVLDGVAGWFAGRVLQRLDTGDHLGFLLEPVAAAVFDVPGLTFQQVKSLDPGHEP
jgi:flavin reductase (DIM6/NTAB) family NADH-FMN oxidoreductase RutF